MTASDHQVRQRVSGLLWWLPVCPYVLTVTGLSIVAFPGGNDLAGPAEIIMFVLLLPSIVVALPVVYVLGGLAWNSPGDPGPLVAVTFAVLLTATAIVNVLVIRYTLEQWRLRESA